MVDYAAMDFFDRLVRLETDLWNSVDKDLLRVGAVGLGALQALRVIQRHSPACRVQEVSHDLGITIGAASKMVDRLERDGLAVRQPNPDDRRSSLVLLAGEGDRARRAGEAIVASSLKGVLGADDVATVTAILVSLQGRLDAVREGRHG